MTFKIKETPDGLFYELDVLLPSGRRIRERRKSPVRTKPQLERYLVAREDAYRSNEVVLRQPRSILLTEAWALYREQRLVAGRRKPSYVDWCDGEWARAIRPILGDHRIAQIGPAQIAALKTAHAERSPKTVNNVLGLLAAILRCAHTNGKLEKLPVIEKLSSPTRTPLYYTDEQAEALVIAATKLGPEHRALILLGIDAGLRAGEMRALTPADVRDDPPSLRVARSLWRRHETPTKAYTEGWQPVTKRLVDSLLALSGDRLLNHSRRTLQKMLRDVQALAGFVRTGRLHSLRHTYVTRLLGAGVPMRHIQTLARHSSGAMTEHYAHSTGVAMQNAAALLGRNKAGKKRDKKSQH